MKQYRKKEIIKAKPFQPGDEDGMTCVRYVMMCEHTNSKGLYKQCEECTADIRKEPYVISDGEKICGRFNQDYLCEDKQGNKWMRNKRLFEILYEEV